MKLTIDRKIHIAIYRTLKHAFKKPPKTVQLQFNFDQNINKPWWMGIVCQQMHYFDLLSQNIDIQDLMKPWEIQDYKNTTICQDS